MQRESYAVSGVISKRTGLISQTNEVILEFVEAVSVDEAVGIVTRILCKHYAAYEIVTLRAKPATTVPWVVHGDRVYKKDGSAVMQ